MEANLAIPRGAFLLFERMTRRTVIVSRKFLPPASRCCLYYLIMTYCIGLAMHSETILRSNEAPQLEIELNVLSCVQLTQTAKLDRQ